MKRIGNVAITIAKRILDIRINRINVGLGSDVYSNGRLEDC